MTMRQPEKNKLIESVNSGLKSSQVLLVSHYKGLTVAEMSDLRKRARDVGARLQVTKNLLAKRAIKDTEFEAAEPMLKGQTVLAFSKDPVSAAKCLVDYAKTNEKLVVIGGVFSNQTLDVKAIEALSKLPSLDELRAKIIGMLKTPATRIASVLQAPGGQVARVIAAKAKKAE